ncbi:protein kinase [Streptomyces sp. NBC_00239]|uniref:protein kinase n=1 Tax=Streptomyces sp. NBC_00239 TaxID=2903640 RepID=UPI002E2A43F0|nr:protein kinase [Streptomyces sp. NBC_00239]
MEEYAGRVLADRYRLPLPPSDAYELVETRAFDTRSGQEVLVRQVPLPEIVDAELLDAELPDGAGRGGPAPAQAARRTVGGATRRPAEPAVRRAIEAAQAAAGIPDHPRLDQVFDVFAEGGSLWIVSELVLARPLAALLADRPLSPYRAAEVASDVLTALRVLHAHGWTHRNITTRTVLVCEDGRVVLTGLAAGAAEEALCGYDVVPPAEEQGPPGTLLPSPPPAPPAPVPSGPVPPGSSAPSASASSAAGPPAPGPAPRPDRAPALPAAGHAPGAHPGAAGPHADGQAGTAPDLKAAARAGAIAAYRAGAQAAARVAEERRAAEPEPRPQGSNLPQGYSYPYGGPDATWHGATPRTPALPAGYTPAPGPAPEPVAPAPATPEHAPVPAPATAPVHVPVQPTRPSGWDEPGHARAAGRGPGTPLAAERARQTRIAVVGALTERWAPEQAHPVHENWQLAAPVGPATDLWALGALLYRAVQGHAPYPEDNAAELVEMVCSEPPAYAEECGPLRPVVESLLRQDPTERPDFEELRGWLRSLVRSAPEADAGIPVVEPPVPDATRLPIVRRRGELVRRRRGSGGGRDSGGHGRHRHRQSGRSAPPPPRPEPSPKPSGTSSYATESSAYAAQSARSTRSAKGSGKRPRPSPRPAARPPAKARPAGSLGRNLLIGVLVALAGAVAYAMVFLPETEPAANGIEQRPPAATGPAPQQSPDRTGERSPTPAAPRTSAPAPSRPKPQTTPPVDVGKGYTLARDTEGFQVAVPDGWDRRPINDAGQVRYTNGDYELIVVPGRDAIQGTPDPLGYQRDKERELNPYRSSSWATAADVRSLTVGQKVMAEGQYTWTDAGGRNVFVRNRVLALGGRYHVVMAVGPEDSRDKVTEIYQRATASYQSGG